LDFVKKMILLLYIFKIEFKLAYSSY